MPPSTDPILIADVLKQAIVFHNDGDLIRAQRLYRLVLCLEPGNFDAIHLLGVAARRSEDPLYAVRCIAWALRLAPGNVGACQNLRNALQQALVQASEAYRTERPRDLCDIARKLVGLDQVEWVELAENLGRMLNNVANTALYRDGDVELASACTELAASFNQHPALLNFRMLVRLYRQDYDAAWNREDWRIIAARTGQWDGEFYSGTLILLNNNGMGDFLQFMRFIPLVRKRVGKVVIVLRGTLKSLVRHSFLLDGISVVDSDPCIPNSVYCDLFSLGFVLELKRRDIAFPTPYVSPPADLLTDWRRVLRRDRRMHVAIHWSSWGIPDARAVPFEFFGRLIAAVDAVFIGLHASFSSEEMRGTEFPENFRFLGMSDLSTTVCVLGAVDLVIAPDGGIAHLACALGIETWVLTTRNCDWRWRVEGETSDWYSNARLFRQPEQGDWDSVFRIVADRLQARCGA